MAKKKNKKRRKLKLSHIIVFSILIYIGLIFGNQKKLRLELETKKNKVQSEVDSLEKEIAELNEEIENSDTLQFVEKIARDELGLVKPREIIYIDKNKKKNPFLRTRKGEN